MSAANGFVFATSVAVLLVHLYRHCLAGCNCTLPSYTFGAPDIAAYVVGADVGNGGVGGVVCAGEADTCTAFVDAGDPELLEQRMGCYDWEKGGDADEDERLHGKMCGSIAAPNVGNI